jgi:hypothetical protein
MSVRVIEVVGCAGCPLKNGSDQGWSCRHPKAEWRRIPDEATDTYDTDGNFVGDGKPEWCPLGEEPVEVRLRSS